MVFLRIKKGIIDRLCKQYYNEKHKSCNGYNGKHVKTHGRKARSLRGDI